MLSPAGAPSAPAAKPACRVVSIALLHSVVTMPVCRDNAWNEREYGKDKWPPLLGMARALIDGGERSLSRIVRMVYREMTLPISQKSEVFTVLGRQALLPRTFAWAGSNGYFADLIIEACGDRTDTVVELGSGWGRCLFEVWLRGGPRKARYYGLEITASGRQCAETIASVEPTLDFRTLPFDFHAPDYSGIERSRGRAVIFSDFNICQIPRIRREIFTGLKAIADEVVGVVIEPFGWQIPAGERDPDRIGSSRAYAELHDYNRNLWEVMKGLEREGILAIDYVEVEAVGLRPENSMSVARWRLLK